MIFLLTYRYENEEGMYVTDYEWYKTKEDMIKDIEFLREFLKDFEIHDAMEILNYNDLEIL
jgi:hypothetical protein